MFFTWLLLFSKSDWKIAEGALRCSAGGAMTLSSIAFIIQRGFAHGNLTTVGVRVAMLWICGSTWL